MDYDGRTTVSWELFPISLPTSILIQEYFSLINENKSVILSECELNHTLSHSTTHPSSPDQSTYDPSLTLHILTGTNINTILPPQYVFPSLCPSYPSPSLLARTVYRIRYNFPYLGPLYSPISPVKYNLIWSYSTSQLCPGSYLKDTAKNYSLILLPKVFLYSRMPSHSCY